MTQVTPLLECAGVSKSFGGVQALTDVTLRAEAGKVTSLIGPNGAGKTTLFDCLSGFQQPTEGVVAFDGVPLAGRSPHTVVRRGLSRTFQTIRMFEGLTVLESVLVAQAWAGGGLGRRLSPLWRRSPARDEAMEILGLLGLTDRADRVCTELPLLGQRRVEVARAIATQPKMLLLDEPSAGATPKEALELLAVLEVLIERGVSVLLIEHNVPFVMEASSSVWVLHFGRIVCHGSPDEVQSSEVVREIYLGGAE